MKMKMLPWLEFDIQVEILKRLPVKSLIQFRSVCKAWKSLIDSSPFIADHNNVSQDHHLMIRYRPPCWQLGSEEVKYVCFVDDDDDSFPQNKFATPPVPPIPPSLYGSCIIDTSCGLVCLEGYVPVQPDGSSKTRMVVLWNPSIRKSIAIVVPNDAPSEFHPFVGFGVCPETKDPKLLKISYKDDQDPYQVMVFTLSSREWRCLSSSNQFPHMSLIFMTYSQTVIGRFFYGLVFDGESYLIWSFDLSTYEFRKVPVPDSVRQSYLSMSKLRESLVLIDDKKGYSSTDMHVFDVWMMMEDGAFTKQFTITKASIERILGFRKTGEPVVEIEIEIVDDVTTALIGVYEPFLDHIKDLGICRSATFSVMCSYNESLLLLDHDDDDGCIEINLSQLNGIGNIGFEMIIPLVSYQTVIGRFLYRFVFDGEFYLISSFDLSTEEFGEVPLPDSLRRSYLFISKLRESLVLIEDDNGYPTTYIQVFNVWMMMQDGAFTKLFTIKNASVGRILGFKKTKTGEPVVEIEILDDVNRDSTTIFCLRTLLRSHQGSWDL
ncbi:hypothetical protein OSB04_un000072 [Centaurea solstitialis]|uniref:F-box domain-containing protein n=1 Tax=Centaurea solstitialis TaxID=347529 RepID=A0AA38SR64_9ASTR|nr:hypothetical protein OSB04_un000072 [Centaurea solstitialis]